MAPKADMPRPVARAVQTAQTEDARLFVEVLHGNGTPCSHQVVPAVLQQRIHGHHQKAAQTAQQHQERRRDPDVCR